MPRIYRITCRRILGIDGDIDAIETAEQKLIDLMMAFDYENQI